MNKFFKKTLWAFENPVTFIKELLQNDDTLGFIIGLMTSGLFFVMYSASPLVSRFPLIYAIITCIAIPFVYTFMYKAMPTRDELDGLAPKRKATTILNWFMVVMIVVAVVLAYLFIHFSYLLP